MPSPFMITTTCRADRLPNRQKAEDAFYEEHGGKGAVAVFRAVTVAEAAFQNLISLLARTAAVASTLRNPRVNHGRNRRETWTS